MPTPRRQGAAARIGLFGALLAGACQMALADPWWDEFQRARAQGQVTTVVDVDNDTLLFDHRDGFYTSGARLTRQFALEPAASGAPALSTSYGWRIGQELYTASDIKLLPEQLTPHQHPYAGWLYGGVFRQTEAADGAHLRLGIDLGCLGPCAGGRATQVGLHHLIHQPQPQGWSTQLRNEPGLVMHADVASPRLRYGDAIDVMPSLQGRFGNIHTDAAGSLLLRAGQRDGGAGGAGFQAFTRVQARAVGYDATLQGGYFSEDNAHAVRPKRLVGEAEAGLSWRHGRYGVSASIVRRSNEIAGLSNAAGAQNFARLQFMVFP